MVERPNTIWRDFATDGVSSSGAHKPRKSQIRAWGEYIQAFLNGGNFLGYTTKAAMDADLAHAAGSLAIVYGESATNDGLYLKSGASGAGSWAKIGNVPGYSFETATDGGGTANAIVATTIGGVDSTRLIALPIEITNTATPVTVAFNGDSALTIKTAAGNNPAVGGLVAGTIVLGYGDPPNFRLLSDQASAAIQAAAEAAQAAAETAQAAAEAARDLAQDYASNAAASASAAQTSRSQAELAALAAGAPFFADTTSGIAGTSNGDIFLVSTATGVAVYENNSGTADFTGWLGELLFDSAASCIASSLTGFSEGQIIRTRADGFSYEVAASGASDHHVTTAGGVKLYVLPTDKGYNVKAFGAAGDNSTDDTAAVQAAIDAVGSTLPYSSGVWNNLKEVNAIVHVPAGRYLITSTLEPNHNCLIHGDGWGSQFFFDPSSANSDFIAPTDNTGSTSGLPGSNTALFFRDFYVTVKLDGGSTTGRNSASLSTVNSNSRHCFNFINGAGIRIENVMVTNFHYGTAFRFSRGVEEGRTDLWAYYNTLVGCYARDCLLMYKPTSAMVATGCYFGHSVNYPALADMASHEYMVDFDGARGCSLTGSVEGYAAIALINDNGGGHGLDGLYLEAFTPTPYAIDVSGIPDSALSVTHGSMSYGYGYQKNIEHLVSRSSSDVMNVGQNFGFGDCEEIEIYHNSTWQSPSFRDGLPGYTHSPTGGTSAISSTSFVGETCIVLTRGAGTAATENGFTYNWKIRGGRNMVANIWCTCLVYFEGAETSSTVSIRNLTPPQTANFKKLIEYSNGWQLWGTYLTPGTDQGFTFQVKQLVGSTDTADKISITAFRAYVNGFKPIPGPYKWPEYRTAAPTAGTWRVGEHVWNSGVAAAGDPGWVCTTAGTPGTWKAFANVDA